ncbi:Zinc finger CCCH domain-containing protein [Quillaja saponaria]|uniref:Zinc finger CCCH domain-containing protein n=1 Tax=Quillaja saponaria TaxID=32244 RepID=A0AAD7L1F3_QUISA|nr:Zinc finger CCCH domain-containing protein [Quillaja saponaria]
MTNPLFGYSPTYGGASPPAIASSPNRYLSSTRYLASDQRSTAMYFSYSDDALRYSASSAADFGIGPPGVSTRIPSAIAAASSTTSHLLSQSPWYSSIHAADLGGTGLDPIISGIKRSSQALYHPTVLGAHNTVGQSEAWYSSNLLTKRPRYESAINLHIYPQRPGEKDCTHYMQTRTCKFGESCKFDHPIWVPEGGILDWKEVPDIVTTEDPPERPGQPDCPYFLKTQRCKFGSRCKFNHPKDQLPNAGASENAEVSALPKRPFEPPCAFYMKTGKCKFGATCKFNHPKDIHIQLTGQEDGNGKHSHLIVKTDGAAADAQAIEPLVSYTPALMHNSKGLPVRPGEVDCPFYLKTGSCKYGTSCRYNHPDRNAINPPAVSIGLTGLASPAANLNVGVVNPVASIYQAIDPRLSHTTVGVGPTIYPQRPGQIECDYYMKTGECKFGERCKYHHPTDRSALLLSNQAAQQTVKLTLAGLPRREGAIICPYYLKTGTCKYGATCKFDHPPPGEVMAMATTQGTSNGGDEKGNEKGDDSVQEQQ